MKQVGDILKTVFKDLEKKKNPDKEEIESIWEEQVGKMGLQHSKPTSLRKTILTVRVDNSGWLQKLTIEKRKILKGLKRTLGKDKISDIHFRIGEF